MNYNTIYLRVNSIKNKVARIHFDIVELTYTKNNINLNFVFANPNPINLQIATT